MNILILPLSALVCIVSRIFKILISVVIFLVKNKYQKSLKEFLKNQFKKLSFVVDLVVECITIHSNLFCSILKLLVSVIVGDQIWVVTPCSVSISPPIHLRFIAVNIGPPTTAVAHLKYFIDHSVITSSTSGGKSN